MPLAHAFVTPEGGQPPSRWMVFLHGILGSGANWRTFARQLVAARPGWGVILVDLRLHGESRDVAGPHTVAAAADDVVQLVRTSPRPGQVRAVLGHSFGGKVALAVAEAMRGDLDDVFVVDSTPSARPERRGSEETQHIIDLLRELPADFPDRGAFTAWIEARGVSRPTAMWLAMNVKPVPNTTRYVFRIDVAGIREMLEYYFRTDYWRVLETPPGTMRAHLIVGGRSDIVDDADRARARRCPGTTLDVLEDAGHWVHVDAPDALRELVLGYLDA